MTEAAEEIRAAADPEANIIFGTSFNERLGDEVMITVIATGFDGNASATNCAASSRPRQATDASAAVRAPRERDFLEELERQRIEPARTVTACLTDAGRRDDTAAATAACRGSSRARSASRSRRASRAYDADDLEIPSFLRRK